MIVLLVGRLIDYDRYKFIRVLNLLMIGVRIIICFSWLVSSWVVVVGVISRVSMRMLLMICIEMMMVIVISM